MDGSNPVTLHSTHLSYPYGLIIDYESQTLYWTSSGYDRIEKSSVTGNNRVLLSQLDTSFNPYGIVYYNGTLYWSDLNQRRIYISAESSYSYIFSSYSRDVDILSDGNQKQGSLKS